MIFLQLLMITIVFSMPLFAGFALKRKSLMEAYLFGQVLLWATFQIIAVPMIILRFSFNALFATYVLLAIIIVVFGMIRIKKEKIKIRIERGDINYYMIPALLVIIFQAGMYVFGQHLDQDDARWIAEACDALDRNVMLLNNAATGDYLGKFTGEMVKDVFSPWSIYIATLSRMTFLRPAIIAHTVSAPILLGLMYLIYYLIGNILFKGKFERATFLLMTAIIMLFFNGNRYTQATFALTRIWQGKAVAAAVAIPLFLLILLQIEKKDEKDNWLLLIISSISACLFSGMGIAISFLLVSVYGTYAVCFKRLKRIKYLIISICIPSIYGLLYYCLFKI